MDLHEPLRPLPAPGHADTRDRSQRSRNWMRPEHGSAMTSRTRSSTTTRGSPTPWLDGKQATSRW
jgi:hypothetical protein